MGENLINELKQNMEKLKEEMDIKIAEKANPQKGVGIPWQNYQELIIPKE